MHYTGTIWRPPYEASSLLLEVTAGCTHHKCKFCTLYHDLPFDFRMSPFGDVEADLQEAKLLMERNYHSVVTRIFLTGANPFALHFDKLMITSKLIKNYLPQYKTIGCFSRISDITLKTDQELIALKQMGFDGLTIGIETGDNDALSFMNKGYVANDIITQCKRLDNAKISYKFFYLTGISGMGKGEHGAKATADVCNQLQPQSIGANMLTIYPESELYEEIKKGNWEEESEIEKYKELMVLVEHLQIETEFAALGASNAVQIRGFLPKDKHAILQTLKDIIAHISEADLRQYRKTLPHL